jgi:hypothetical protein
MMTLIQAETEIKKRINQFAFVGLDKRDIRLANQPNDNGEPYEPPKDKPWCRVSIQYADSNIVGMGNQPCIRKYGIIAIQCFTTKNTGTITMTNLCESWANHLQSYSVGDLEIYLVHAPQSMDDDDFYAKIIRAEFSIN